MRGQLAFRSFVYLFILFYFILFCFVLFRFVLFYFIYFVCLVGWITVSHGISSNTDTATAHTHGSGVLDDTPLSAKCLRKSLCRCSGVTLRSQTAVPAAQSDDVIGFCSA
jgi:hypothetical protein